MPESVCRTKRRIDRLLLAIGLGLLLAPCLAQAQSAGAIPPEVDILVQANTLFAFDLYHALQSSSGNLFFSPYSVSLACAMTYSGARGETETQMAAALRFSLAPDEVPAAFALLGREIARASEPLAGSASPPVELSIANALWGERTFAFLQSYLDLLDLTYGASLKELDFRGDPEGARETINQWTSDETKGRIQDLLPPGSVDTSTRLVLTNAIYFLGSWAAPFDPSGTGDEPFTLLDGSQVSVATMHVTAYFPCAHVDDAVVVELPYLGDRLSLLVFLSGSGRFAEEEAALSAARFAELSGELVTERVALSFPKFRVESEFGLRGILERLGMTDAFDADRADLSGMDGARDLVVSDVVHKAFVQVDEKGTEAAAATAVIVGLTSVPSREPIEIRVDRPFLFAIRDRETGTVLFLGRVVDPR